MVRIYITRHGESVYNTQDRIGGDPNLSINGKKYIPILLEYCKQTEIPFTAYTSTKKRTKQTITSSLFLTCTQCKELDEINAGIIEGLTYTEFKCKYPIEYQRRKNNKLTYRYPGGESYVDLIKRVSPFIAKINKEQKDVFIVCHRAVTRALLAHLIEINKQEIPHLDIPLHTILKLEGTIGKMKLEYKKLA